MDQQIWQWTLTKDAIAPCFVRDVLDMRQHAGKDTDFFWLGHTPCRTVVLVAMVVAVQVYDKRTIYTIDDGTAVIDCVLRHPQPTLPALETRSSPSKTLPNTKTSTHRPSPKKARLDKWNRDTLQSTEPPPPITEPGYPVRVVGRIARHYQSRQIYVDTIDLCASSLDEIAHLERVIELHKTKYSKAVPFVVPPQSALQAPSLRPVTPHTDPDADASVFSSTSFPSRSCPDFRNPYSLPAPPTVLLPLQDRNRPSPIPNAYSAYHRHAHVPSSPTTSSMASSTPSSPCKLSSPVKVNETPRKPKLRHPSRLHTRDLTGNTFRLYVKHYMDNAPLPSVVSCSTPMQSTCGSNMTPTKRARDEDNEQTPRPRPYSNASTTRASAGDTDNEEDENELNLGFTLSHLRRVPELALLATRVVRAEARRREKADRAKERENPRIASLTSALLPGTNRHGESQCVPRSGTGKTTDLPRKKMKRLFSWAVVKLHEEGSIVLWDGGVRPLPVPPPPVQEEGEPWKRNSDTLGTVADPSRSYASVDSCGSASVLYTSSASAPLYSHYHAPRRPSGRKYSQENSEQDIVDPDADPAYLSDPLVEEEAYVPLTPRFLVGCVRDALSTVVRMRKEPTPGNILAYMQRADGRWARVGVWAIEETLGLLRAR